ncbi:hypothetical protein ACKKBF_B12165 [Auxenochlorella protothecoides x Auxenochlorella symbiontica]
MGAYLSQPITEKETAEGENELFCYGVAAMQGWRMDMEDAHSTVLRVEPSSDAGIFAVFDGHGGKEVAKYAAVHVPQLVVESEGYRGGQTALALSQAFLAVDDLLVLPEHREELKALRGGDKEEKQKTRRGEEEPMVINGGSLPDHILEALGLTAESGVSIRLVRNGARGLMVEGLTEDEEDEEAAAGEGDSEESTAASSEEEAVAAVPGLAGVEGDGGEGPLSSQDAAKVKAKRKRVEAAAAAALRRSGPSAVQDAETSSGDTGAVGSPFDADADALPVLAPSAAEEELRVAAVVEDGASPQPDTPSEQGEGEYLGPTAGCTAVCALVKAGVLTVANAGDSRCVLSRGGVALAMTQDHKPDDPAEYARIINAGGFVADGRVNGSLNLSRALGDMEYKQSKEMGPEHQAVTAVPEVRTETLQAGDEFLILACDGIWDVLTVQEAVDFARERLLSGKTPREVCEAMCDHCLAPDTDNCGKGCDNMSVIVVVLKDYGFPETLAAARAAAATNA